MPPRKSPTVVEPGEYEVTVIWAGDERSQSGDRVIVLNLVIGRWGRFAKERLVFKEACWEKIAEFLIAMGEEFTQAKGIHAKSYLRRSARALVEPHEYRGHIRNRIVRWLPAPDASAAGSNPASKSDHCDRLDKKTGGKGS